MIESENNSSIPEKKVELDKSEEEKLNILSKADEVKGEQLFLDFTGEVISKNELEEFNIENIEDPEEKFKVYYNGIQKLLISHLPKGEKFAEARNLIFEEKNVFLTRGKRKDASGIRGADSRMGYITDGKIIVKIIMDWIATNGTMTELYNSFCELNEKHGYGKPQDSFH